MGESVTVEIIIPGRLHDELSDALVEITAEIQKIDADLLSHGCLGGEHGYGAQWDGDVFMMRPYCWCEREDCRWCSDSACGCPEGDLVHFVDERPVSSEDYWAANRRIVGPQPSAVAEWGTPEYEAATAAFYERVAERDKRIKVIYPARIHACEPRGMMADRHEGDTWKPSQTAPNFWHKPTGLKVWWYKWIGRDPEVLAPAAIDVAAILASCVADVRSKAQAPTEGGKP